jgi:hypothetical protein
MATVLDPSKKGSGITITQNGLGALDSGGSWGAVLTTTSKNAGKWMFGMMVKTADDGAVYVGVANSSVNLNGAIINDVNCWLYGYHGDIYHGDGGIIYDGVSPITGTLIEIALDIDDGEMYISKNGLWLQGSDPEKRILPAYTGISGNLYILLGHVFLNRESTLIPDGISHIPKGYIGWDGRINQDGGSGDEEHILAKRKRDLAIKLAKDRFLKKKRDDDIQSNNMYSPERYRHRWFT